MKNSLVIFSGGPDSTAAALWAISQGYSPTLLTFQFKGQEQYGELFAAMKVAEQLKLPHEILDFRSPMQSFSPFAHVLMHAGTPVLQGDKSKPHRMPFGGGMILATACNYALYHDFDTVVWGATRDDKLGGNPEYSQEFADKMADTVSFGTGTKLQILVPFAELHKHEAFIHFKGKEAVFAHTWSCKIGVTVQSGTSKACIARRVAARLAGLQDATIYASSEYVCPLTEEQMQNPSNLKDDDLVRIFESEHA